MLDFAEFGKFNKKTMQVRKKFCMKQNGNLLCSHSIQNCEQNISKISFAAIDLFRKAVRPNFSFTVLNISLERRESTENYWIIL